MDQLIAFVTILVVISGAAERLVEIIKTFPFFGIQANLAQPKANPRAESTRQFILHCIALAACLGTTYLAKNEITAALNFDKDKNTLVVALALLSAGGSSLWNSVLTYLLSVKDIKKADAIERKLEVKSGAAIPSGSVPVAPPTVLGSGTF